MFMYDLTADLQTFYDTHVRLGFALRKQLGDNRDLNVTRLKVGLDDLAAETDRPHPHPYATKNQGGYAMHTLKQDPSGDNGYDIDVALLFARDDLPADPLKARQRVCAALGKRCTNFTQEPTARANAVTVWYADGYHIDFAVYRTYTDDFGQERIEHASTEWKRRDPMEVNNWFVNAVASKSPKAAPALGYYPEVADGQMRRIVRFVKWFCRSRASWSLTGGMVVSTLVAEVYRPDSSRDDRAFCDTLVALRDRLKLSCRVWNPVDTSQELTGSDEVLHQVERLRDNLDMALGHLAVLFDQRNCTREKARSAWDWLFNHSFWGAKEAVQKSIAESATVATGYSLAIRCDLARKEGGPTYKQYPSASTVLPKGVHLRFSVVSTNVPPPYEIRWIVQNEGDEAREAEQLSWNEPVGEQQRPSEVTPATTHFRSESRRRSMSAAPKRHCPAWRKTPASAWATRSRRETASSLASPVGTARRSPRSRKGSEYPAVVIPVVTGHYQMLARNLLYTSVTRGKRLVVLVAQRKAIGIAVRGGNTKRRWTKLTEWLSPERPWRPSLDR